MADITFTKIADPPKSGEGAPLTFAKQEEVVAPSDPSAPVAGHAERDRALAAGPAQEEGFGAAFKRGFSEVWDQPAGVDALQRVVPAAMAARTVGALAHGTGQALASTGRLGRDIAAMPEAFMGMPGALQMPGATGAAGQVSEALFPGAAGAKSATLEDKARQIISKKFAESQRGGETTALDVIDKISAARQSGQPMTLADVGGKPIERLAGTVYRSSGESAAHMEKFYAERGQAKTPDALNTVQGKRIEDAIGKSIAEGSYRQETEKLVADRTARGRPLWEAATAGGSIAPLEHQFEVAFGEASIAEQAALRSLADARNELTQAKGRQSTAGNVYSASGANRSEREATQAVKAAEAEVTKARAASDQMRTLLRQAQDDGSASAPGAVWSPRLQEFLDSPEWRRDMQRGLAQERRDAVTERRPFNPSEYAIIGTEADGTPIVGKVPTVKLLQVAREGRAARVDELRDPLTGGLSKEGRSVWLNLKAFEEEGFRLSPAWEEANDAWAGDTAAIRALQLGKKIFSMPLEDLQADFAGMSASEKEMVRLGAANKMIEDVRKTPLAADPSKRVINTADELQRFRVLFEDQAEFGKFADFIDRERTMFETPRTIMRGSQTAERMASDLAADAGVGAIHLAHGNWLTAMRHFARATKDLGLFRPKGLELEVAKQLTNPDVMLADTPYRRGLLAGPTRGGIMPEKGSIP